MSKKTKTKSGTQVFKHRYKWSGEEIGVISVLLTLAAGALIVAAVNHWTVGWLIITGIVLFFAGYAFWLGNRRKNASAMTVTYNEATTELEIDGHTYEGINNHVRVADIKSVGFRQLNTRDAQTGEQIYYPKDLLILSPTQGKGASLPLRLLSNKGLMDLLAPAIASSGSKNAKEAAKFGEAYKR